MSTAQINVGDAIPAHSVKENAPDASSSLDLSGKNIIVGVPGAFTGTCHAQVPGYIEAFDDFQAKGVRGIYIVSVNDVFVTKAWKENLAPKGSNVHFIADDTGAFSKSLGLTIDATPVLGGTRSTRYVLVIEDNKVTSKTVEADPSKLTTTAASAILPSL
ncbi:hypothetical protein H0H92_009383 [Tricholoma furcatifolium]|nr:hypothetical protein H0H92_009383 [Tricholoma furcatifolium]